MNQFNPTAARSPRRQSSATFSAWAQSEWAGLFAPRGVPPEVIAKLADALDKALEEPVVRERLAQLGGAIPAKAERNPAAFDRFIRSEIVRWAPILAATRAEK